MTRQALLVCAGLLVPSTALAQGSGLEVELRASGANPQSTQAERAQPYLLLATTRASTLAHELSQAAAEGYIIQSAWTSSNEMLVLLDRTAGEGVSREVRVVNSESAEQLVQAGQDGFRLVPGGIVGGHLLFERSSQATDRFEYQITNAKVEYKWDKKARRYRAKNYKEFEGQLQRAVDNGFRLAGFMGLVKGGKVGRPCDLHAVLLWERPDAVETVKASRSWEGADYRLVEGYLGAEFSERVNEAAADGYVLTTASTLFELPGRNHLALIMERVEDPSTVPEHLVLTALDVEGLTNQVSAAGAHGYRVRDWGLFGNPLIAIVERAPGDRNVYDYTIVETDRTTTLQRELLEASEDGRVVGATTTQRRGYNVNDEEDPVEGIFSLFGSRPQFSISYSSDHHLGLIEVVRDAEQTATEPTLPHEMRAIVFNIGKKPSDLEKELNKVARNSYRLFFLGAAPDGETVDLTLRKVSSLGDAEYRVLATGRDSTMQDELNELAQEGFHLAPGAVFAKPTKMGLLELAAVMERRPGLSDRREYLVLTTGQESTLDDEISDAQVDRYEIVARLNSGRGHAAFLERPVN